MSTNKSRRAREIELSKPSSLEEHSERRTVDTACFPSTARLICSPCSDDVSEEGAICTHGWPSVRPKMLPPDKKLAALAKSPLLSKPSLCYTRPLVCESDGSIADGCSQESTTMCTFQSPHEGCSIEQDLKISFVSFAPENLETQPGNRGISPQLKSTQQTTECLQQPILPFRGSSNQSRPRFANNRLQRDEVPFRMRTNLYQLAGRLCSSKPRDGGLHESSPACNIYQVSIEVSSLDALALQSVESRPQWDSSSGKQSFGLHQPSNQPSSFKTDDVPLQQRLVFYVKKMPTRSHRQQPMRTVL